MIAATVAVAAVDIGSWTTERTRGDKDGSSMLTLAQLSDFFFGGGGSCCCSVYLFAVPGSTWLGCIQVEEHVESRAVVFIPLPVLIERT